MSVMVPKLREGHVTNIIAYLQANLPGVLDVIAAASPETPAVSLETPKSWFIVEKQQGYALPAVFVMLPTLDFRIKDKASNFINAEGKTVVVLWVEDQDEEALTYKAWRYEQALYATLDQSDIYSADNLLHLKVVVYSAESSGVEEFVDDQGPGKRFRKALLLRCQVEHLENYA
jgi:hypothetical protein